MKRITPPVRPTERDETKEAERLREKREKIRREREAAVENGESARAELLDDEIEFLEQQIDAKSVE